jgi:hypothetical protein
VVSGNENVCQSNLVQIDWHWPRGPAKAEVKLVRHRTCSQREEAPLDWSAHRMETSGLSVLGDDAALDHSGGASARSRPVL